jgi:hypothetical protein
LAGGPEIRRALVVFDDDRARVAARHRVLDVAADRRSQLDLTLLEITEEVDPIDQRDACLAALDVGNDLEIVALVAQLPVTTLREWHRQHEIAVLVAQGRYENP